MRYTILGFNQEVLVSKGLGLKEAMVLRWFVDYYSTDRMVVLKQPEGEKPFVWVKYQAVIDDLPVLEITSKKQIYRIFNVLCDSGIFEKIEIKKDGTYIGFRLSAGYKDLIHTDQKSTVSTEQKRPLPMDINVHTKDSSIKKINPLKEKYFFLSELLRDKIKEVNSEAIINESTMVSWCKDFDLMVRLDKRSVERIKEKIELVFAPGEFWGGVIRSAGKLRIRWNEGKLPGYEPKDELPFIQEEAKPKLTQDDIDRIEFVNRRYDDKK